MSTKITKNFSIRATLDLMTKRGQSFLIRNPANAISMQSAAHVTAKQIGAKVVVRAEKNGLRVFMDTLPPARKVKIPYLIEDGVEMGTARGIVHTTAKKKVTVPVKPSKAKAKVAKPAKKVVAPKAKATKTVKAKLDAAPTPDFLK